MSNFANNLISLRKSKNLSQQQASQVLGLDLETYQKLEFEMEQPSLEILNKVASFYEVDAADLRNNTLSQEKPAQANLNQTKNQWASDDMKKVASTESENVSPKSRGAASALAWFLGCFGAHNFYLGKTGCAVFQLILTLTMVGSLVSGIWAFIEAIMLLCGSGRDGEGREVKKW